VTIRLVDAGWEKELIDALCADASELKIVCPFIKASALDRLFFKRPRSIQTITRFNLDDFAEGVSDIAALRKLLEAGATIRGVRNLRAKLYLFGVSRAIVTSANLTEAAITRNHEFGMVADDRAAIASCRAYFDALWQRGGSDLTHDLIDAWDETVTRHLASGGRRNRLKGLGDFGADAGIGQPPPISLPTIVADARQAFVKFLGEADKRVSLSFATIEEIRAGGLPLGRRRDGRGASRMTR
jgi:hypothetical protein